MLSKGENSIDLYIKNTSNIQFILPFKIKDCTYTRIWIINATILEVSYFYIINSYNYCIYTYS